MVYPLMAEASLLYRSTAQTTSVQIPRGDLRLSLGESFAKRVVRAVERFGGWDSWELSEDWVNVCSGVENSHQFH